MFQWPLTDREPSSRGGTHWLTPPAGASQYLQLSAWNAVLVPTRHLREPLLGGRTQHSAGTRSAARQAQFPWQPLSLAATMAHRLWGPGVEQELCTLLRAFPLNGLLRCLIKAT